MINIKLSEKNINGFQLPINIPCNLYCKKSNCKCEMHVTLVPALSHFLLREYNLASAISI